MCHTKVIGIRKRPQVPVQLIHFYSHRICIVVCIDLIFCFLVLFSSSSFSKSIVVCTEATHTRTHSTPVRIGTHTHEHRARYTNNVLFTLRLASQSLQQAVYDFNVIDLKIAAFRSNSELINMSVNTERVRGREIAKEEQKE